MGTAVAKRKGGMPTKYRGEKHDEVARELTGLGHGLHHLAQHFLVSVATIEYWQKEFPSFRVAISLGREDRNSNVQKAIFERAIGYRCAAEKIVVVGKQIKRVKTIEHYPPDTAAAKFWLVNRAPLEWRDRAYDAVSIGPSISFTITTGVPDPTMKTIEAEPATAPTTPPVSIDTGIPESESP